MVGRFTELPQDLRSQLQDRLWEEIEVESLEGKRHLRRDSDLVNNIFRSSGFLIKLVAVLLSFKYLGLGAGLENGYGTGMINRPFGVGTNGYGYEFYHKNRLPVNDEAPLECAETDFSVYILVTIFLA